MRSCSWFSKPSDPEADVELAVAAERAPQVHLEAAYDVKLVGVLGDVALPAKAEALIQGGRGALDVHRVARVVKHRHRIELVEVHPA